LALLERNKRFVRKIAQTGGGVFIALDMSGQTNLGDVLPAPLLARMGELEVALSIEVFPQFD
jgi:hypothetical protein